MIHTLQPAASCKRLHLHGTQPAQITLGACLLVDAASPEVWCGELAHVRLDLERVHLCRKKASIC